VSSWELTNLTAQLVLPPGVFMLLALVGLAFVRSRMRVGAAVTLFSLLALFVLTLPVVSQTLVRSLEMPYSDPAQDRTPGAIVVLGGGSRPRAPEYGMDTVGAATLERLRYAAHLHKRTGKPILVTSGNPAGLDTSEGEQMKAALREFGVSPKWVEAESNNTLENARMSQQVLKKAGVQSVYVVTHAWHMPRAKLAFERAGLHVVPAPTGYTPRTSLRPLSFVPSAFAMAESYVFFHEILGTVWYRLKFDLGR
jgi:uncharacterized SAM-binding protein YcdF (DUF218 family)